MTNIDLSKTFIGSVIFSDVDMKSKIGFYKEALRDVQIPFAISSKNMLKDDDLKEVTFEHKNKEDDSKSAFEVNYETDSCNLTVYHYYVTKRIVKPTRKEAVEELSVKNKKMLQKCKDK